MFQYILTVFYRSLTIGIILCITACQIESTARTTNTREENILLEADLPFDNSIQNSIFDGADEAKFNTKGLAIRSKMAAIDLAEKDAWWRKIQLGDPHKYLLPIILARLSLNSESIYDTQKSWDVLLTLDQEKPDLYHFRSGVDVRIFFLFQDIMPAEVKKAYENQLQSPRVLEWIEGGTENHMFMHRASGLALMNGSGLPVANPATAATNEAWLRSELNKFLTIGQGEFHSSVYYGYSISGLLNLYDFSQDPELKKLAKGLLDWYATNMALRLSWGTAGGAESRGFDRNTWDSGLTAIASLWWGENQTEFIEKMNDSYARLGLNAALSSYRPPQHLKAIALKQIPLPFEAFASHPPYYSYSENDQLWETFYVTEDYSLGTLLEPGRVYQVEGTIRAQYATYKLVIRDPNQQQNVVISLGGTYHTPLATGRTPGDQYLQKKGTVIYQSILTPEDLKAGVPPVSRLVLPSGYGAPQRYKNWYIWQIHNVWLCARVWGDTVGWETLANNKQPVPTDSTLSFEGLTATGNQTAWITEVTRVADYPTFEKLTQALDRTQVDDSLWLTQGKIDYQSLTSERLTMTYDKKGAIATATINGQKRVLKNSPVIASPYVNAELRQGTLKVNHPQLGSWRLKATLNGPEWIMINSIIEE
ncbi:MAG: hypothetical protein WBA77_07400 [Microcoleaceae cyanobacterium]